MVLDDVRSRPLRVYAALTRLDRLGYAGKILLIAFVGIHVPLLALVAWFLATSVDTGQGMDVLVIALVATLAGTAVTLYLLHQLLRPITLTATALRTYVAERRLPALPTGHADAVGTLMADTMHALARLEEARDALEHRHAVTGLPNRTRLLAALAEHESASDAAAFALCTIGVDGLDTVTAAFGLTASDRLLRLAAAALEAVSPQDTTLYHIDSTTLAIILHTADPDEIVEQLARFDRCFERLEADGMEQGLVCRRGVSLWPLDDRSFDALIDDALVALTFASRRGVSECFYSEGSRAALVERHRLTRDLARALSRDELLLHFQPVVDASRDRIVGAEALIRWQHPERGLLSPDHFIPLAEESALIEEIGLWTLETVCRRLTDWRTAGLVVPCIAINLSARQFADPTLSSRVAALVAEHGIGAGELEVELTETSATADSVGASHTMRTLRQHGFGMSIDDFGTGYSSLSHLRTMPFDKLKIDREFVREADVNENHRAICRTLIALGRELRVDVLAEGAETAAEVAALQAEGCVLFQGFHFHRPMPETAFARLLDERRDQIVPTFSRAAREHVV